MSGSTDPRDEGPAAPAATGGPVVSRPVAFEGIAGWFHPAGGGRGAVIVGAHGYEDLCSRVTLAALADRLAAAGLPTLRIDPRDTGDSADLPAGADRVAAWTADVVSAVRRLRVETGVTETAIVGLRLGALIASEAALELGDVDRLVLLAPPANGRTLVRELSILARLVDGSPALSADGGVEIAGFRLAPETLERLAAVDLARLPRSPAAAITLVGDERSPAFRRLSEAMGSAGARVDTLPFTGYARMMCDPTASEPALETADAIAAHLAADLPAGSGRPADFGAATISGKGFREERLRFGDGLAGVVTLPDAPTPATRSVIWFNSGRNHHIGWARQAVDLSRRLARAGVAVLRMDFAGIGDSPARPGQRTALYHDDGRADVAAAITELERRGFRRPTLVGACSGAYQAFHAAVDDRRIGGIVLVNQLCFVWDASYAVHLSAWMMARPHEFETEARRIEEGSEGGLAARLLALPMRIARRAARIGLDGGRRMLSAVKFGGVGPIERKFRDLAARGVEISIVLSEGDKAESELALHVGRDGVRIAGLPGVEIVHIPEADHSLTPPHARAVLANHLVARLTGAVGGRPGLHRPGAVRAITPSEPPPHSPTLAARIGKTAETRT